MLEETQLAHSSEIKSYKERLKDVMLEYGNYKNSHPEKPTGAAEIMKVDDDKCELTSRMNQMKTEHEEFVTLLILEHKKHLGTMKQQYEETIEMLKNKHDEVLGTLKDMEESKKKEIPKSEETKNGRIESLAKYHNQACTDIQNQFGDINGNNWSTIATLKDENKEFQRRERILQIKFDALSRENEFLKGINSYYNEVTIQKNIGSINRFGLNHLNEELTGMLNEIGQLEITTSQSGPHTQMSQGTFGTAPPTHDANRDSMPQFLRERGKKKLNL